MNLYAFVDNRVNMLCMHTSIWTLFELPMNNERRSCRKPNAVLQEIDNFKYLILFSGSHNFRMLIKYYKQCNCSAKNILLF